MQRTGQTLPCQAPGRPSCIPKHPSLKRRCNTSGAGGNPARRGSPHSLQLRGNEVPGVSPGRLRVGARTEQRTDPRNRTLAAPPRRDPGDHRPQEGSPGTRPPPGVSPGGMQAHYTVSYGVQFFTDGDVGHVQDEDGNEHLECGNLRVIIRRATPPPPPVEIPFEHDNFGIIPWRVHIPAALAAEFSPPAARGHRGPGRIALGVAAAGFIVITELGHRHPPQRVRYG